MDVETFLDIKSLIDIALCTYRTATNQSNIVCATTDTLCQFGLYFPFGLVLDNSSCVFL